MVIASLICQPLIQKIYEDLLAIAQGTATSKTHLYFSSESHLQTLRNGLLHSGVTKFHELVEPVELNYLAHFVFELYENLDQPVDSPDRWTITVLFSTGAYKNPFRCITKEHYQSITPRISIHNSLNLDTFLKIAQKAEQLRTEHLLTGEERKLFDHNRLLRTGSNVLSLQGVNSPPKTPFLDQVLEQESKDIADSDK